MNLCSSAIPLMFIGHSSYVHCPFHLCSFERWKWQDKFFELAISLPGMPTSTAEKVRCSESAWWANLDLL